MWMGWKPSAEDNHASFISYRDAQQLLISKKYYARAQSQWTRRARRSVAAVTVHPKKQMSDCFSRISTAWRECAKISAKVVLGSRSISKTLSSSWRHVKSKRGRRTSSTGWPCKKCTLRIRTSGLCWGRWGFPLSSSSNMWMWLTRARLLIARLQSLPCSVQPSQLLPRLPHILLHYLILLAVIKQKLKPRLWLMVLAL